MTRTLDGQSPSRVQSYLGGVSYPASKDQLLDVAKQNRAPGSVLEVLRRLNAAKGQFVCVQDVGKACTEQRQGRRPMAPQRLRTKSALPQRATGRASRAAGTRRGFVEKPAQHSAKEQL